MTPLLGGYPNYVSLSADILIGIVTQGLPLARFEPRVSAPCSTLIPRLVPSIRLAKDADIDNSDRVVCEFEGFKNVLRDTGVRAIYNSLFNKRCIWLAINHEYVKTNYL